MRYRAYKKSITREILSSKARFASILVIILLGVAFFSGIKSSGPDMNKAINELYKNQNLMDSKIVSTLGLSDKDLDLLKNNDKILDFYPSHTIDANLENINSVVRFMEYDRNNNINEFIVVDGRLPKNSGEIALDEQALKVNKNLKIGDTYTIQSDEDTMKSFNKKTFKIVGIVKSPMYMEKESRGTTTVGKGSIDYFAVVNKDDISMDAYTEIYVRFKNVQSLDAYSDEYKDTMEEINSDETFAGINMGYNVLRIIFCVVYGLMLIVMILLSSLMVLFYVQLLHCLKVMKMNAVSGTDVGRMSAFVPFVGVVLCLATVCTMLPMAPNDYLGLAVKAATAAWYLFASLWSIVYRATVK